MSPASTDDRHSCLRRLGLTEEQAQALEAIWDTPALRLVANDRVASLVNIGYGALDTLDAIWHDLDGVVADTYMQHGLTPHQGMLLHTSTAARLNMWDHDRDIERVHRLLGAPMPADVVTIILLDADSPEEAERLIAHYVSTGSDDYTDEDKRADLRLAGMLDTATYARVVGCDCLRRAATPDKNL